MSLGGTPAAFEDFSLDSRFYSKNPDAIEMLNQKHSSPVLTDKCAKTMPSTFGTPAGLDTQNLENSSDAQTDQEDAGRSISVGAETESIVTHPQGQPQARMDVVIRVDRLGLGVAVSKEYPHPPFFHGYEDNIGELPLFLLQLRRKLAWDKDMFPEPEDQILYAMSRLGETAKSYFAEYMESDGTVRLGSLEEFAEVLSKKYSESEEAVESLKSMIAELESRLKQAESKLKRKETLPKLRIDTWQAFKQYIQNQATFAIQALVGKPKFYWQKSAQEETQPFKTDLEATPSIESWETKWRQGREIPDRIRINSLALLKLLKKVAADDWAMLDLENEETENHSVVFLKPYKFFWYYLDDIRRQKEELYNKFLELEQNPGEYKTVSPKPVQTEDGQAPSSCTKDGALADAQKDRDEMKKSLEGVGWLIRFIENAVMPTATRCRNKDRPPQMITFEELWFLFQPGDVVITRGLNTEDEDYGERSDGRIAAQKTSSEPVAWKVLNSIDGRPRLSPRSGDDARTAPRKQVSHFCLELFKVDFNGASFGPIYRFFNIRYFEGEKDINSLDVVPLWCDKDQDKVKSRLLSIGAKFLDVTKQPYYYQIYNGRKLLHSGNGLECESAMESRENPPKRVNGPVIVDFSTASKDDLRWVSSLGLQQPQSVDTREITEEWPLKVWRVKKADNKNTVNNRQSSEKREQQSYQSTAVDENVYNDLHIDRTLRKKLIAEDLFLSEWEKLNEDDRITADKFEQRFFGDRLLLPDRVCAFVLDNLVFALLTVEGLQDPLQNSQGWNELILPKHGQKVIKTLVKRHRAKNKFMENSRGKPTDDIVAGKGEGLVILLHGAPGVSIHPSCSLTQTCRSQSPCPLSFCYGKHLI